MGLEKMPNRSGDKAEYETCPRCAGSGKASASEPCGLNAAGSIDGNASGTYSPPSGASSAAIAWLIGTVGPALRVL